MPAAEIEDVYLGCANQAGEDNRNVARMAVLLAGLPDSVAGVTLNRLCASGLAAVTAACHAIRAGDGELFVAGGVESIAAPRSSPRSPSGPSRAATGRSMTRRSVAGSEPADGGDVPARVDGRAGENVAERWLVSRADQDAFALESQRRWASADEAGRFADELVAVAEVERDEHPRPDPDAEKLAALSRVRKAEA